MDYQKSINITLSLSDIDRIKEVFNQELEDHIHNNMICPDDEGYKGILEQTRSVLKKVNQTLEDNNVI